MGYPVAARFHDQPPDLPYVTVGRTDGQFAVYFYRALRDVIDGDLLRGSRCVRAAADSTRLCPQRHIASLPLHARARWGSRSGTNLGLLGGPERLELG